MQHFSQIVPRVCTSVLFIIIIIVVLVSFMKKLQELLEDDYEYFESLDNVEKASYVLGSELWESKFDGLLSLVKEYHNYCRCVGNTNGTPCVRVIKVRPYDPQVRVMLLCI